MPDGIKIKTLSHDPAVLDIYVEAEKEMDTEILIEVIDNGEMLQSKELGDQFQAILKEMVQELQINIPTIGVYIWSYAEDLETGNTQHTIISANVLDKLGNEKSICEWIYDAVNGNVQNYGLDLLK